MYIKRSFDLTDGFWSGNHVAIFYLEIRHVNCRFSRIEQKIIKNVDTNFLVAFIFSPISRLANPRLCHGLEMDEEGLEVAFTMAWDAIKL
jgi:hypothetical protein